ncbi:MAG: hypothetical protein ACTSRP_16275 [Candidatus Helarchaeota archaeon]
MKKSRTVDNIRTEKLAKAYLVNLNNGFHEVTKEIRLQIAEILIKDPKLKNSYDLIMLNEQKDSPIRYLSKNDLKNLKLIEVKSSTRNIPESLQGYYFSIQQREIDLAEKLPDRMIFAFVIFPRNGSNPFYKLMTWEEIQKKAKKMRIQVNINF